ncbi:704_t:CDS:2 [Funneliformis mosseae]|uniref:704_t:CDS:1 n=1 Tax=Funneliformis mosseae TaxID=27381 RepID=A0A9N9B2S0_FUNMO|nr:704_t:CDS:2 [Funneliformis mosseae]
MDQKKAYITCLASYSIYTISDSQYDEMLLVKSTHAATLQNSSLNGEKVLVISAQQLKLKYHTVRIPPGGAWLKCAESPQMISYAIELTSVTTSLDPTYYGGEYYKINNYKPTEVGYGFYAEVTDLKKYIISSVCGEFGPGATVACAREGPINARGIWCLAISNPFINNQNVKVVVSFTQSVFVEGSYRKDPDQNDTTVQDNLSFIKAPYKNKKRNFGRNKTFRLDSSF